MKQILLSTLFLIASLSAFGQSKTSLGIKAGINNSRIQNSGLDNKVSLYAGMFLAVRFTDTYTFQPEIVYSNQGGQANFGSNKNLDINYISLGLANKFFVGKNQGFHFIVGPGLDFNFDDNFFNLINSKGGNLKITPIDAVVFVGVGYEFDFGLTLELRYKQGLIDLDFKDKGEYGSNIEENQLNNVVQIGLAYKFKM